MTGRTALLQRAVSWLRIQLYEEDADTGSFIDHNNPGPPARSAVLELALLCRALGRPDLPATVTVDRGVILDRLLTDADQLGSSKANRHGYGYAYELMLLGLLTQSGFPAPDMERHRALIELGHGGVTNGNRPASAVLETRWTLSLLGQEHRLPSGPVLFRLMALTPRPDLVRVSEYEAYVLTHAVFYLTDVARAPWPADLCGPELALARTWVHDLLGLYLCAGHWDLVSELLVCWRALAIPSSTLTEQAWSCVLAAQGDEGAVRSPATGEESVYHTTLVAALAAAVWQSVPDASSARMAWAPDEEDEPVRPAWWTAVERLLGSPGPAVPDAEPGSLMPEISGPALLRADEYAVKAVARGLRPGDAELRTYLTIRAAHALRHGDVGLASEVVTAILRAGRPDSITRSVLAALACDLSYSPDARCQKMPGHAVR